MTMPRPHTPNISSSFARQEGSTFYVFFFKYESNEGPFSEKADVGVSVDVGAAFHSPKRLTARGIP